MAEEIITTKTLTEGKKQLRDIYIAKSNKFEEINKEQYESYNKDEREDSDNHLNEERLKKGESQIIDLAYYKYLPDRQIAYKIILKNKEGETLEDYFLITPEMT